MTIKKSIYSIAASGFILAGIMACNSPAEKVKDAKENLQEAKEELNQSKTDSVADFELFKKESEARIAGNEEIIQAFKQRMITDKKHKKASDQKMIDELEQRNINLRKKIESFQENGKDKWDAFKIEFTHDMDELGTAIKDLTVKNTK
jgi:phosphoenolpyruvate-protein kinase (PTS system EI component)